MFAIGLICVALGWFLTSQGDYWDFIGDVFSVIGYFALLGSLVVFTWRNLP